MRYSQADNFLNNLGFIHLNIRWIKKLHEFTRNFSYRLKHLRRPHDAKCKTAVVIVSSTGMTHFQAVSAVNQLTTT